MRLLQRFQIHRQYADALFRGEIELTPSDVAGQTAALVFLQTGALLVSKEVVRDGHTGVVLPAEDASAWTRAMLGLILDRSRRQRMGQQAEAFIRPMSIQHSFEHFIEEHALAAERARIASLRGRA